MKLIGIDIGGTKSGVILANYKNDKIEFMDKTTFPTGAPDNTIKKLLTDTKYFLQKYNLVNKDITAAGINCGGPLNSETGTILCPPNLPGWVNIPIVKLLESELGLPCYLQNDANAGAIAEYLFGAGRGYDNIMFLTCGTGMGAGLILNGKLYSGTNDMAGEVGHIRLDRFGPVGFGKAGSFEGFCSGGGIGRLGQIMAQEKLQLGQPVGFCDSIENLPHITGKTLADAARAGDPLAKEVFTVSGTYLGRALAIFIDILNPQLILLGSVYGHCKDLLYDAMMEEIKKEALSFSLGVCKIEPCGLGETINDYEAVSIAIYGTTN